MIELLVFSFPKYLLGKQGVEYAPTDFSSQNPIVFNFLPVFCKAAFLMRGKFGQYPPQSPVNLFQIRITNRYHSRSNVRLDVFRERISELMVNAPNLYLSSTAGNFANMSFYSMGIDEQLSSHTATFSPDRAQSQSRGIDAHPSSRNIAGAHGFDSETSDQVNGIG